MTLTQQFHAQCKMTKDAMKLASSLQQALELIAMGDEIDAQLYAGSVLVEMGLWVKECADD